MWKLVPSKITKEWLNPTKTINHNPIKKLSGRFTKLVNQPLFLLPILTAIKLYQGRRYLQLWPY